MVYDEHLAERVRELTGSAEAVTELRMFGGWGVTLHGNLAVGVLGDDLIVRVGPDAYGEALARPGVRPFDITGRAMRGWVFVDGETVRTRRVLTRWVGEGVAFAQSLPPKAAASRRRRTPRQRTR
jgi:TfoX/Sxy family transcriptional regulator of competence genes